MKVVCSSDSFARYSNEAVNMLSENDIDLVRIDARLSGPELYRAVADADALITAFTHVDRELLSHAPGLKIVTKHGVGVDNINLQDCSDKNIWVTNVPDANKHAVADYAFGLLLACARMIPQVDQQTRSGLWPRVFAPDVYGKTLGVVGLGKIGQQMALRASGFRMQLLAYDPMADEAFARQENIRLVSLQQLLAESDYVSLHLPLLKATENIISSEAIAAMKPGAFLVNAARGGLVDEAALAEALKQGHLGGAALDVFEHEPLTDSPLFEIPNLLVSSHIAGYTEGAVNALSLKTVENIIRVLVDNDRPDHVVNTMPELVADL